MTTINPCPVCGKAGPHGALSSGGENVGLDRVVGKFCIACLGRQLYRAGFNPERTVRIKCRACGQGEADETKREHGASYCDSGRGERDPVDRADVIANAPAEARASRSLQPDVRKVE